MNGKKLCIVLLMVAAMLVIPVCAAPGGGGGGGGDDDQQPIEVDVDNYNYNYNDNVNRNYNYNDNDNWNFNENRNYNFNFVDVDQKQKQDQQQDQSQEQKQQQKQKQDQSQFQIVSVPQDDTGIKISNANRPIPVAQLEVGEAKTYSRLVYPGEVLPIDIMEGQTLSLRSASDVAIYTIGGTTDDIDKINSLESVPEYNPISHKFDWGFVVPIDKINYWTTKATLTAGSGATYVVIDNRAPRNGYTHIELTIQAREPVVNAGETLIVTEQPVEKPVPKPDTFPTDAWGRAITS